MLISIPIFADGHCLLKENQLVDFSTPFLKKKSEEEVNMPVAKNLGVPSEKIFRYLKKFVGESIEKGEVIAINKTFFSTMKVISKYSGQIKEINHFDGSISISVKSNVGNVINAYFKGKVNKIKKSEVLIEVDEGEQFSGKNINRDFGGKVFYSNNNSDFLSDNLFNSVVVCDNIVSYLKAKAEALGCQGFLTLSKLTEGSETAIGQFAHINDYKKAIKSKFPYCTIISASSKIYFYK